MRINEQKTPPRFITYEEYLAEEATLVEKFFAGKIPAMKYYDQWDFLHKSLEWSNFREARQ